MTTQGRATLGRIVQKDGAYHFRHSSSPGFTINVRNYFNCLVDTKWRYVLLSICLPFPVTWLLFAAIYYLISWQHGDFSFPDNATANDQCISNSVGFLSMFLFSFESQTTIGYGYRYVTESCPLTIFVLCIQYLTGALLEACVVSLVWIRLIRPKTRSRQIIFSRHAVINVDEMGRHRFQIRLFDTSSKYLVQTWIRLYFAKKWSLTPDSSQFTFELKWMDLGQLYGKEKLLLLWPMEVTHIIDPSSPLYEYTVKGPDAMNDMEIIAVVEGVVEATGLVTQTRTSYVPQEIKWNHRFAPTSYLKEKKNIKLLSAELDTIIGTSK